MIDTIAIFSIGLPTLAIGADLSSLLASPLHMAILIIIGFVVGTAVGASGIGGAALIVPSLLFLGVSPQAMVGASLLFNFCTKILGTVLHSKHRNISWRAFIYVIITVAPSMVLASWVWTGIKDNFGTDILDVVILFSVGILLVCISVFMVKKHVLRKRGTQSEEAEAVEVPKNFSKGDKTTLLSIGGLVSFMMTISSVGAGTILVPVLLKVVKSPKHVAGISMIFGLVASILGSVLHYSLGELPIYLVAFLLAGSLPGVTLGVKIASTTRPRKLTFIFSIIILVAGLLILQRGLALEIVTSFLNIF